MPNRVIRSEILTSDAVNLLSWPAEVFYRRLMSVVDDFGRYDARTEILRSSLYPLKLNKVPESDVEKWMNECSETGLIRLYSVDGKPYLEILKFGQTLRIKKSKYPECKQMKADVNMRTPEKKGNENESETEDEDEKPPEKKVWNKMPSSKDLDPIPEIFIKSAKEQIYLKQCVEVEEDVIMRFWNAWKIQNITGTKHYENQDEVYKHFVNSIKKEKFSTKPVNQITQSPVQKADNAEIQNKYRRQV